MSEQKPPQKTLVLGNDKLNRVLLAHLAVDFWKKAIEGQERAKRDGEKR